MRIDSEILCYKNNENNISLSKVKKVLGDLDITMMSK